MNSFRDRFFTRRTAEAIMAPSSILLGGAGTAVAILAGAPIVAAAGVGAAVYAGWVALRMPRARAAGQDQRIDLSRLRQPWRWYVREARDSQTRFRQAVANTSAGPLQERLAEIGARLDDGVAECWRIANRGQELEAALAKLVPVRVVEERIRALQAEPPSATSDDLIRALRGQAESFRRIEATAVDARNRLQVLEVRLDEAVARAVELSLQADDPGQLHGLGADVDSLVAEMEALRHGLEVAAGQTAVG
jgi:nitroreductase